MLYIVIWTTFHHLHGTAAWNFIMEMLEESLELGFIDPTNGCDYDGKSKDIYIFEYL